MKMEDPTTPLVNEYQLVIIQTMANEDANQIRLLAEESVGRKLDDFTVYFKEEEVIILVHNTGPAQPTLEGVH